jgi:hypothetical protein
LLVVWKSCNVGGVGNGIDAGRNSAHHPLTSLSLNYFFIVPDFGGKTENPPWKIPHKGDIAKGFWRINS